MASAIPPVLVELQLETANLKKGLEQLNQNFSNFGETIKKQTSFLSNFKSAAVGVFAGNVMTQGLQMLKSGIQGAIANAQEFERVTGQLQAGLVSTGNVAGLSVEGIKAHASALEQLSGVDENLILQSQAVFQTFTNVRNVVGEGNDIFNQASLSALDLATKMGGDLQGATVQLGKALNDPVKGITALTRVGVVFTASQKEQIKALVASGDVMGAQKIILAEMNTEFGGAAKAAGDTFAGAVARAKDKVEDFTRDLITNLQPILLSIGKTIGDLISKYVSPFLKVIKDNKEALLLFVGVLASAYIAVKLYGVILGVVKTAQTLYAVALVVMKGGQLASIASTNGLAASMLRLNAIMRANPIGVIVTAIALLAAGFVIAWNKSETFRKVVVEVAKGVLSYVAFMIRAWGGLIEIILKVVTGPLRLFLGVMSKLPGVGDAAKKGLELVNKGIEGVGDFADKTAKKIEGFKSTLDGLKDKKIKIPGFGGSGKEGEEGEGADAPTSSNAAIELTKKLAAKQAKLKKKAVEDFADLQEKLAEIQKNYDEDVSNAHKRELETRIEAQKQFNDRMKDLNEGYAKKQAEIEESHSKRLTEIETNYAESVLDIKSKFAEKMQEIVKDNDSAIENITQNHFQKIADIQSSYAEKLEGIVQKSIARLTDAFKSATQTDVGKLFGDLEKAGDVSGEALVSKMKERLGSIKKLAENASALAGAGFSQTFIEQVMELGPDAGNKMAEALLKGSPESAKEMQDLFQQLEDVSNNGVTDLAKSMSSGGKFATQALMEEYKKTQKDLADALNRQNIMYQMALADQAAKFKEAVAKTNEELAKALSEAAKKLKNQIAEEMEAYSETLKQAQEAYDEAIVNAAKARNEAFTEAQEKLAEDIAEAQKTLSDALTKLQKVFRDKLDPVKALVTGIGSEIAGLGGQIEALLSRLAGAQAAYNQKAAANAASVLGGGSPTPKSPDDAKNSNTNNLNLNINANTDATPESIANAALNAIRFGLPTGVL